MSSSIRQETSNEIYKQLHDLSNALTILVGKVELLAKNGNLAEKEKNEIQKLVSSATVCFDILEKAKNAVKVAA